MELLSLSSQQINLPRMLIYLLYFFTSAGLFSLFFKCYVWWTPINEIKLIKEGNTAVAWVLAGTLVGYTINLSFAMFYSYTLLQFIAFGIFSAILQLIVSFLIQKIFTELVKEIRDENNVAAGILVGAIATCVGIINGASAY